MIDQRLVEAVKDLTNNHGGNNGAVKGSNDMKNKARAIALENKARGKDYGEIADILNGLGFTTASGIAWKKQTVGLLVRGPRRKKKKTVTGKTTIVIKPAGTEIERWMDVTADHLVLRSSKTQKTVVVLKPKA